MKIKVLSDVDGSTCSVLFSGSCCLVVIEYYFRDLEKSIACRERESFNLLVRLNSLSFIVILFYKLIVKWKTE